MKNKNDQGIIFLIILMVSLFGTLLISTAIDARHNENMVKLEKEKIKLEIELLKLRNHD